MSDEQLLEECQNDGRVDVTQIRVWREASPLLAVFDAIGRDGATALFKVDGARLDGAIYTVVVSGGPLQGAFFHKDGADFLALLREAIAFYQAQVWSARG